MTPMMQKPMPFKPMPMSLVNPDLELMVWDPAPRPAPAAPVAAMDPAALRMKLRDRYIAARFPGVARSSADFRDTARVIKGVRLYFEEQSFDRASELLDLAIGEPGSAKLLRLARLELAYLRRDAARYTECALDLRRVHPDCPEWPEVVRLGCAVAPAQTELFGHARSARLHDSYGAWPQMPNWLQASWDLTGEVLAADFHREMTTAAPDQRLAA